MRHPNTRALFRYWNGLRGERAAPFRSEIDPKAISTLLESTFILEHEQEATPRFRLAGTRLCDQFGMELRGLSALALWHGDCRARVKTLLQRVVEEPCIGHLACTVETRSGHLYGAEFLYLPLRSDLGEMTRILGCGYYMGGSEVELSGYEPLHHWIDAVQVFEIDGVADSPESKTPFPIAPQRRKSDSRPGEKRAPASVERLDALRKGGRPPRAGAGGPKLRSIEGGLSRGPTGGPSIRDIESALRTLRAPLQERAGAGRDATHLRLVKSDDLPDSSAG